MPYPQNKHQDVTHEIDESRFHAIQVEQNHGASMHDLVEDDEEIIDIGAAPLGGSRGEKAQVLRQSMGAEGRRQTPQASSSGDVGSPASSYNSRSGRAERDGDMARPRQESRPEGADDSRYVDRFEERDFGVEDLPPMPIIQKVILFVAILAIVFIGYKLVCYWIGI